MKAKKKETVNALAEWARHVTPNMIRDRLLDAPASVVRAAYFASVGVPVMVNDANRQQVALEVVAAHLADVRASRDQERALVRLTMQLASLVDDDAEDDDAFERFQVEPEDVAYLTSPKRNARRVTAWLLRRAGACGVPRRARPTEKEVAATMNAMKQKAFRILRRKTAVTGP
jgi:hypothetical protein